MTSIIVKNLFRFFRANMVQLVTPNQETVTMSKLIKFNSYGPFEVPIEDRRVTEAKLNEFWKYEVGAKHQNLKNAVGCYIFATRHGNSARPWYVGKTERASFKDEAFQPSKLLSYINALKNSTRGTAELYLIARITESGRFRRATKKRKGSVSITKLEELLIGACLSKNPDLLNKRTAGYLKKIQVPGYMNEPPGKRSKEAQHLKRLLES